MSSWNILGAAISEAIIFPATDINATTLHS